MFRKLSQILPLLVILLFAFFLRFWMIDSVAPGISIDEIEYTITAKSYFLTGTDLVNKTRPLDVLRFVYPSTDGIKAELSYLMDMPFVGPFPFSLPMARLPFILCSLGTVFLLYKITKELFDKKTGLIASLLGAVNPFLVISGRTMYEIVPATFLFLLGLYILIKAKGYKILLSIPVFFFAFYAYIGTKLLFVPFILFIACFTYFFIQKRKDGKYYLAVCVFAIGLVLVYVGLLHINQSGTRLNELLTLNSPQLAKSVDTVRKNSLATPLTPILFNKGTMYAKAVVDGLYINFSSGSLFMYSDGFFRVYNFGVLYYIDAFFILAGIAYLFSKQKKLGIFLLGLIIIATLPQVLHTASDTTPSYTHTTLIFPLLVIIAAVGVQYIVSLLPIGAKRNVGIVVLSGIYLFSFLTFFHVYFYQYPLVGKDDFPTRIMSRYAQLAELSGKQVIIMSPDKAETFRKYMFYTNAFTKESVSEVKQSFISSNIRLGNLKIVSCSKSPQISKNTVIIEDALCGNKDFMLRATVPFIIDGGTAYKIYQDSVCGGFPLKSYPSGLTLSSLQVEKLSTSQFCEDFITH